MPLNRRLRDLEESLDSLYEKLGKAQKRLAYTNDIFEKDSIEQRIRKEVLPEIREREAEYWQLLAQEANSFSIDEVNANNTIAQVVQQVVVVQNNYVGSYSPELNQKLDEILAKLNQPEKLASGKLVAALPLIPSVLSYEIELDPDNALSRAFQPIRHLFRRENSAEKK